MTRRELEERVRSIRPADAQTAQRAEKYLDSLAMPPGSLGRIGEIAVRLAGMTGETRPEITDMRILVFCADNGVTDEGVAATPVSVTAQQAVNMTRGCTGMSCLAAEFGCDVQVIDVGIATPYTCAKVRNCRIRPGTEDIAKGPAMSEAECLKAMETGIACAHKAKADGIQAIGIGEMGIGNTTTSAAVLAVLTGLAPEKVTGRGAGLTDDAYERKIRVVARALSVNRPDPTDVIGVLTKVGGLDLAAMCGAYLGATEVRLPAVIDGFISIVAALCAVRLCPPVRDDLFPSHASEESGYQAAAQEMGIRPYFDLSMRLGEGSGCPLAFQLLRAASAIMHRMATFEEAGIRDGYLADLRERKE